MQRMQALEVRDYRSEDAKACHALRRAAFLGIFSSFLHEDAVRAGAESYGVSEFGDWIGAMDTYVALVDKELVGFCSIRLLAPTRAEILYLYVNADQRGTGIGARLVRHAEQQVSSACPELAVIFLDTAVPECNQMFWERMGYQPAGASQCEYPTGKIPALRFEKRVVKLSAEEGKIT
jgi:GNAT superfamily N-acetyltransferase